MDTFGGLEHKIRADKLEILSSFVIFRPIYVSCYKWNTKQNVNNSNQFLTGFQKNIFKYCFTV